MTVRSLVTVEEFIGLPGDGRFDLIDGVVFYRKPAGASFETAVARVVGVCRDAAEASGLVGLTNVPVIFGREPDTALSPSVAYVARDRLPPRARPSAPLTDAPDFIVDVRAPSERAPLVRRRIAIYLAAGVRLVWLIDPLRRSVSVVRPGASERRLTEADDVSGEDVLPGFAVRVGDLLD